MPTKHRVELTLAERERCLGVVSSGKSHARSIRRANVLLKADSGPDGPGWTDKAISAAFGLSTVSVANIRRTMAQKGLEAALSHYDASGRDYTPKLDGRQEAHLIALSHSAPPEGHLRWSLRLLAKHMVLLGHVEEVSHVTVSKTLKRGLCNPGATGNGASLPPKTQSS